MSAIEELHRLYHLLLLSSDGLSDLMHVTTTMKVHFLSKSALCAVAIEPGQHCGNDRAGSEGKWLASDHFATNKKRTLEASSTAS